MYVRKSEKKRFCCPECQHEWQKTRTGKDNPKYKRIQVPCKTCGALFYVQNYKASNENLFCSKECKVKWYAEVWSQRAEWKEESSKRAVRILAEGKIPSTYSKPHQKIVQILEELHVEYMCEYPVTHYAIDIYLPDYNLMIEIMGDFWHCNPSKFNCPKYKNQVGAIRRDNAKHTYVKRYYDIEILYLWETDINEHTDVCTLLIQKYIDLQGQLDNYHSFNYTMVQDQLVLNDKLFYLYSQEENIINNEDAC